MPIPAQTNIQSTTTAFPLASPIAIRSSLMTKSFFSLGTDTAAERQTPGIAYLTSAEHARRLAAKMP